MLYGVMESGTPRVDQLAGAGRTAAGGALVAVLGASLGWVTVGKKHPCAGRLGTSAAPPRVVSAPVISFIISLLVFLFIGFAYVLRMLSRRKDTTKGPLPRNGEPVNLDRNPEQPPDQKMPGATS
jgi:hypothetical protein